MSSIVTAVFKATIGLLVNKGRDKAAEKLKDGDVTDQKFRGLIVREIDDIKSKLDGISRKDLLASISFFEEGIELLYKVFDKARSRSEYGAVTTQADCAEAVSLAEGVRSLELTDLHESAARALSKAKKRFEDARREATRAFNNEALETSDRILAMQYRVMATILETVDNPVDAVEPCRVCIKELNSLSQFRTVLMFSSRKALVQLPYNDDIISVEDVATDITDNIFVLVGLKKPGTEEYEKVVCVFNNTADLHHKFPVRDGSWRLTVTDVGKLMLLRSKGVFIPQVVDMYYTDGQFVRSFGEDILKTAENITAANDGRVMVVGRDDDCVHIFSQYGNHLNKFKLQEFYSYPKIAYHRASEHVVVAGKEQWKGHLQVEVYTKDGEFVSSTQIHDERIGGVEGMTVTPEGRIAVANYTEVLVI
ncbi:hypothetical protein ACROYT_G025184 [Oculina patagonica]